MFSHFVTAAKGLFVRQDSGEFLPTESSNTVPNPSESAILKTSKMVTATGREVVVSDKATAEPKSNGSPVTNGKRKARPAGSGKADNQTNKRRKRSSLESQREVEENASNRGSDDQLEEEEEEADRSTKVSPPAKRNHMRFDDEEPAVPVEIEAEEAPEPQQGDQSENEDSSDDDAPEAIDNSAQLSKIRAEAKRQEKAKQIEEQLKRERRRQLDERHKTQAKSTTHKKKESPSTVPDDLLSESTATLQGSTTQDNRRSALPALLPDEILNAEPIARPPTPPDNFNFGIKKPNKLRFLDKVEKAPKDVIMGDVAIRVLDGNSSQKKDKASLAPRASKAGRNVKENWLNRSRSTASVNGLRRTTGGSSGFVRRK